MKRISYLISLALCSLLLLGVASSFKVSATDSAPVERWDITENGEEGSVMAELYELSEDEYSLVISGNARMTDWSIDSPAPWSSYAEYITTVTVEEGVLSVGNMAFFGLFSLESLCFESVSIELSADAVNAIPRTVTVYAHSISTAKLYCERLSIGFASICTDFQDSMCSDCDYKCENHSGGTATCTDGAVCTLCKTVYEKAAGHTLSDIVTSVPADCENNGRNAYYICTACNLIFDEDKNETEESALVIKAAHSYGELIVSRSPTCTEVGIVSHYVCKLCGECFDEDKQPISIITIDSLSHSGNAATCISAAVCIWCGEVYENINPDNHVNDTALRYDGINHWEECECGAVLDKAAHSYTAETVKEATETEDGRVKYSCDCGYSYTLNTPKLSADGSQDDSDYSDAGDNPDSGSDDNSDNGSDGNTNGDSGDSSSGDQKNDLPDTPNGDSDTPNQEPSRELGSEKLAVIIALSASAAIIIATSLIAITVYVIKKWRNKNV